MCQVPSKASEKPEGANTVAGIQMEGGERAGHVIRKLADHLLASLKRSSSHRFVVSQGLDLMAHRSPVLCSREAGPREASARSFPSASVTALPWERKDMGTGSVAVLLASPGQGKDRFPPGSRKLGFGGNQHIIHSVFIVVNRS